MYYLLVPPNFVKFANDSDLGSDYLLYACILLTKFCLVAQEKFRFPVQFTDVSDQAKDLMSRCAESAQIDLQFFCIVFITAFCNDICVLLYEVL